MDRSYYVVDAFASEPFTGNPAAVVLDAGGLDDDDMLRIAAEFNLSETTFVLPPTVPASDGLESPSHSHTPGGGGATGSPSYSVRFRWFTPTVEPSLGASRTTSM